MASFGVVGQFPVNAFYQDLSCGGPHLHRRYNEGEMYGNADCTALALAIVCCLRAFRTR